MGMHKDLQRFFVNLEEIWRTRKPDRIRELMSGKFKYYEDPFSDPITDISELISTWREIETQDLRVLEIKPLFSADRAGAAMWECTVGLPDGTRMNMKGVYLVELDRSGRCSLFRQWWNEDTNS